MAARPFTDNWGVTTFTYDPASIGAATTAQDTVTVPGLKVGDIVVVQKPTLTVGVGIVGARVSAADTLALQWVNATAGAVNPASETYTLFWFRPEASVANVVQP